MRYIARLLSKQVKQAAQAFPAVLLTGPRQCGKTTLLRRLYPKAQYVLLEDPDVVARVRSDPRAFLDDLKLPVILDEIQNVPELLRHVRTCIDLHKRNGQWLLTGSQEAPLMQGVTESMAGRAAVLQLLPLSTQESSKVDELHGGYPDALARPRTASLWFRSYLQTYLERDVRAVTAVKDLGTFRRFLQILAARSGAILNKTDIAAPLGVSIPTITGWLNVLEVTGQILLVPPFYENFGKRLIKSPKLYFTDTGLLCHLLGLESLSALRKSSFHGAVYEGFVASEVIKQQLNSGRRKELYYFRDQQGLEVDFLVPQSADNLMLLEAKATRTPTPAMAGPMQRLAAAMPLRQTQLRLVHAGAADSMAGETLAPGVKAVSLQTLLAGLR